MIKIAINGFGRIGRHAFRRVVDNHRDIDVVAINDLTEPAILAHLLRYDSIYGIYKKSVKFKGTELLVDGTTQGEKVTIFAEKDPEKLPWKDLDVDVVLECSGVFTDYEGAKKHITAGAKKVVISAPCKDADKVPSFCLGINAEELDINKYDVIDMGSCTTNCFAAVVKVLHENFTIKHGLMSTVHSYTNDQRILDVAHKDLRRARAAALNIIPTSTGAAKTIEKIFPDLKGRLNALAFRVPTPTVSILDFVCEVEKLATAEEVNYAFKKDSQRAELKGILGIEDALLVSSDYIGNSYSAVVDADLTMAVGNLVKVVAWYDNEWGYASRLAEFAEFVGKKLRNRN